MHYLAGHLHKLWDWLLANNASRATAILVFITGWYAFLTWRMAKAIARQTRAIIQPVALLQFHWAGEKCFPIGYFEVRNLGSQPLLVLDIKLHCSLMEEGGSYRHFTEHYTQWDEHIIPPGQALQPEFNFKKEFDKEELPWHPMRLSYGLWVVTSDLSKQVILTYRSIPVLAVATVSKGMPFFVRWRYLKKRLAYRYRVLLWRFTQSKTGK